MDIMKIGCNEKNRKKFLNNNKDVICNILSLRSSLHFHVIKKDLHTGTF